ncbi:nuclear transport factor 2 family protein [Bradyrhizobium manausense]|uniref:nuclear transport factor 2 family protein n=1 Tax=Bradyrhizobium manausense TaxID=989370 RepID=UPI001BA56290|nr:nuclear transport factor 2 family protein [Bradyrhizobium manausense]MBR0684304.1 nuclear transport factor 2 family protein [Bradyrhizobium manausense]
MAQEAIMNAFRRAFTGYENNDRAQLLALMDDAVVFEFPDTVPYGGRYEGLDAYKALWARLYATYYKAFDYDLKRLIDGGDHVVAEVIARAVAKTGQQLDYEQCLVFALRDGRIVHGKVHADTERLCAFLARCELL